MQVLEGFLDIEVQVNLTNALYLQWYGLEEVVSVGVVLALSNLSYRGSSPSHPWPTAALNDHAVVSHNPREKHLKLALDDLQKQLPVSWCTP